MTGFPPLRRERHYGGRVVRCFAGRPAHVDAMLREAVARGGERTALVCGGTRLTYRALDAAVDRLAAGLARRGLKKGDRVALMLPNGDPFVVALLAAARLGAVCVPMNVRQRRPETLYMLRQCAASAIVYDGALEDEIPLAAETPSLRLSIRLGAGGRAAIDHRALAAEDGAPPAVEIGEEDLFCLVYTSGTTGRPKGAMLTHLGVVHSAVHYAAAFELTCRDVGLVAVPLSHVTGLIAIALAMIRCGGRIVVMPGFRASDFLSLAAREKMTYTLAVPAIYNLCLLQPDFASHDLSSWRVGGFGGAPMPQATIERLARALPDLGLYNIYGSTETSSPVTILSAADMASRADSVGRALPCCDVFVADDAGIEVARGTAGELWIAGPNVSPGYWDDPEATRSGFVAGHWLSGDVGSMDGHGYVRVFDRKKDVVNRGGYKIYSIEVENEIVRHPALVEAAVLGRADPVLGEKIEAFVVLREGASISRDELRAHCARAISDYKLPDIVTVLDAPLPRNAAGKVAKNVLREMQGR